MADKNILFVEGKDDLYVLRHLILYHGIPESFAIKETEGVERLLESLPIRLKASERERIGVLLDANADLAGRWESLRNISVKSGYTNVPTLPESSGTIIKQLDKPMIGFWLMPNNTLPGMLENFVQLLVPSDDALWALADDCLQRIPKQEQRFLDSHRIKAQIHTWLAWQENPGTPMGLAITKRYLKGDAPLAQQLIKWIRRLFFDE
jgi:Protein of unknown function (DUF3226)